MAYKSETGYTPSKLDPSQYGINYDADAIKSTFDSATAAQYKTLRNEYDQTANQFYANQYNNQATALDTIRKANAQAIANGASRGIQSANELSAVLNLQQQGTEGATDLASRRNQLADQEQSAYAQNAVNALQQANTVGSNIYSADTQYNVGQMQYYSAIEQALKNLEGVKYAADKNAEASKYTADQNLSGTKYNADANYSGNVYTANQNLAGTKYNADQNLAGNKYSADQNLAGQQAYASAYQNAAATSAAATRYAAQQSAAAQIQASSIAAAATKAAQNNGSTGNLYLDDVLKKAVATGGETGKSAYITTLVKQGISVDMATESWNAANGKKTTTSSTKTTTAGTVGNTGTGKNSGLNGMIQNSK